MAKTVLMALLAGVVVVGAACAGEASNSAGNAAEAANAAEPAREASGNASSVKPASAKQAPDLAGARALIDRIYTPYTRANLPGADVAMTPELEAAIERQSDPIAGLGFDPFCQCQDFERFTYSIRSLEPTADGAVARVATSNFGESRLLTLRLARRGAVWLVADIGEGADSLLKG